MNSKLQGFLQALGVFVYCGLIGLFMFNANHILGKTDNFSSPILFLLLFSTSVLVCALFVFYKPYKLFFDNKKKEAINVVVYTSLWLLVFLFIFFLSMILFK